ncbi:MAG: hypothetical protein CYPHOPRED_002930 [Cyphobasidiales sp. Tagirdzhanova-0007]|nr:MAG: hypothetical protein CYPHOPRED_002930 [Cyphobasidiales sp. Tagirdzhanova-0007]
MEIAPQDLALAARSNSTSAASRLQATQAATDRERSNVLQEVSLLQEMSIYVRARLPFNPHRQLPVDGSHANASGLSKDRFLVPVVNKLLSPAGLTALSSAMVTGDFPIPPSYPSIRSLGYVASYTQHEALALISIGASLFDTVLSRLKDYGLTRTAITTLKLDKLLNTPAKIHRKLIEALLRFIAAICSCCSEITRKTHM